MNLYDFTDVADLPDSIRSGLKTSKVANPKIKFYADLVQAATDAGQPPLSIIQIAAIGFRLDGTVVNGLVIRGALNSAVSIGLINKPTRQTYAGTGGPTNTADVPPVANVPEAHGDPEDVTDTTSAPNDALEDFDPLA